MNATFEPEVTGRTLTGRKVLLILMAFFGTVFLVNGLMLHYAIVTFPGVVESDAYEHGLAWDKDISAARQQEALGWKVTGAFARKTDGQAEVSFIVHDRTGTAVTGLAVTCSLEFPADRLHDHQLTLAEVAQGEYRGIVAAREGGWKLGIDAERNGERVFRTRNRVTLQ